MSDHLITDSQPVRTRSRSGLRMIKDYCEDMAFQENSDSNYHTLLVVDPDVIHMAAFPLENVAQGSVFHAWGPLRAVSRRMSSLMRSSDVAGRIVQLTNIFERHDTRVSLLTSIALSTYIFKQRGPLEKFSCYAVLPPHQLEWDNAILKARQQADQWRNSLSKIVDVGKVREIVERASRDRVDVADALLHGLPQTVSALFPAHLSPDHGLTLCMAWRLSGAVRSYEKIPGLPRFDSLLSGLIAEKSIAKFARLITDGIVGSQAFSELDTENQEKQLRALKQTIDDDAKALAFVEAVKRERPPVNVNGEVRPLRVILLTASARIWRVAQVSGDELQYSLRSPLSYLGDGNFFKWAFHSSLPPSPELGGLLDRLRDGLLSVWLGPLTADDSSRHSETLTNPISECLRQWERLMSHLATSLNLSSPSSSLRKALRKVLPEGAETDSNAISALLQHKIVDATNRLSLNANQIGLIGVAANNLRRRNLPPVKLTDHEAAGPILREIPTLDLSTDEPRLELLRKIMSVESHSSDKVAGSYYQSILISLLWYQLQHWAQARDVAEQAAAFALLRELSHDGPADHGVPGRHIDGEEALYVVAITARMSATEVNSLELARLALRAAQKISPDDVRFQSEEQLVRLAEFLMRGVSSTAEGMARLEDVSIGDTVLKCLQLVDSPAWTRIRASVKRVGDPFPEAEQVRRYRELYSLQQLYCAMGMFFIFAYVRKISNQYTQRIRSLVREFGDLSLVHDCDHSIGLVDSQAFEDVRLFTAYCFDQDESHREDILQRLVAFHVSYRDPVSSRGFESPLDRMRTDWLAATFPPSQLAVSN